MDETLKLMTPIMYANHINRPNQMVYGWIRSKTIPEDCLWVSEVSGRTHIVVDKADVWYATRKDKNPDDKMVLIWEPIQILDQMVLWYRAAGLDKEADALQKVRDEQ